MDYPEDVYMSPRTAVWRFGQLMAKYGVEEVSKPGHFKVEKELLDAGVFFMGLEMVNKLYYFFRPGEDISSAIDIRAITAGKPDAPEFKKYDVQLTEFESHNSSLIDVIKKKVAKQGRADTETRDLVVIVRDHGGETFYPEQVAQSVAALSPTFKSVWVTLDDEKGDYIHHLIQAWPVLNQVKFSIQGELDKGSGATNYVRLKPGTTTRTDFDHPEELEFPLP